MKPLLFFCLLILAATRLPAQEPSPVSWSFNLTATGEGAYEFIATAEVDPGWYVYSQYLESDLGPIATAFHFDEQPGLELSGKTLEEGKKHEGYDPLFEMNITKFSGTVRFVQKMQLAEDITSVEGYLEFMTCDEEKCLPPKEVEFSLRKK